MGRTVYFIVGDLQFAWDSEEAEGNLEKHHLTFEEGTTVFQDKQTFLLDDPDEFEDDVRFQLPGYSAGSKMLVAVHVERRPRIRIVSVRRPTRFERDLYGGDAKRLKMHQSERNTTSRKPGKILTLSEPTKEPDCRDRIGSL